MSRARLLLVDDDASIRRFVEMALETVEVDFKSCANVSEAVQALKEHGPVDLLITDLMMPGESGLDLLQRLQNEPDLRGTARLAVFSAGLHGSVQTDLARYDIWRQLSKPVSAAELEECVLDAVHWAGRSVSPHVIAKHPSRQEDVNPLSDAELAAARDHFSGDLRLFKDFREGCLDQFAADLDRGNASILSLDLQDLRHLSHSLKSVLLLLGHRELSHTSRELEVRAADGDVHGSEESWNVLAAELERLIGKPHRR